MARWRFGWVLIVAAVACASHGVQAEVTRIEIASRTDVLGGKPFGGLQRLYLREAEACGKLLVDAGSGGIERRMRTVNRHAGANQIEQDSARWLLRRQTLQRLKRQWMMCDD